MHIYLGRKLYPHVKLNVLDEQRLNIEAHGWYGCDNLVKLQFVENG